MRMRWLLLLFTVGGALPTVHGQAKYWDADPDLVELDGLERREHGFSTLRSMNKYTGHDFMAAANSFEVPILIKSPEDKNNVPQFLYLSGVRSAGSRYFAFPLQHLEYLATLAQDEEQSDNWPRLMYDRFSSSMQRYTAHLTTDGSWTVNWMNWYHRGTFQINGEDLRNVLAKAREGPKPFSTSLNPFGRFSTEKVWVVGEAKVLDELFVGVPAAHAQNMERVEPKDRSAAFTADKFCVFEGMNPVVEVWQKRSGTKDALSGKFPTAKLTTQMNKGENDFEQRQETKVPSHPTRVARLGTRELMGMSARDVALLLNNKKPLKHNYEWLHRIAHSILGGSADRASNLFLGTKHANTQMIPYETLVKKWRYALSQSRPEGSVALHTNARLLSAKTVPNPYFLPDVLVYTILAYPAPSTALPTSRKRKRAGQPNMAGSSAGNVLLTTVASTRFDAFQALQPSMYVNVVINRVAELGTQKSGGSVRRTRVLGVDPTPADLQEILSLGSPPKDLKDATPQKVVVLSDTVSTLEGISPPTKSSYIKTGTVEGRNLAVYMQGGTLVAQLSLKGADTEVLAGSPLGTGQLIVTRSNQGKVREYLVVSPSLSTFSFLPSKVTDLLKGVGFVGVFDRADGLNLDGLALKGVAALADLGKTKVELMPKSHNQWLKVALVKTCGVSLNVLTQRMEDGTLQKQLWPGFTAHVAVTARGSTVTGRVQGMKLHGRPRFVADVVDWRSPFGTPKEWGLVATRASVEVMLDPVSVAVSLALRMGKGQAHEVELTGRIGRNIVEVDGGYSGTLTLSDILGLVKGNVEAEKVPSFTLWGARVMLCHGSGCAFQGVSLAAEGEFEGADVTMSVGYISNVFTFQGTVGPLALSKLKVNASLDFSVDVNNPSRAAVKGTADVLIEDVSFKAELGWVRGELQGSFALQAGPTPVTLHSLVNAFRKVMGFSAISYPKLRDVAIVEATMTYASGEFTFSAVTTFFGGRISLAVLVEDGTVRITASGTVSLSAMLGWGLGDVVKGMTSFTQASLEVRVGGGVLEVTVEGSPVHTSDSAVKVLEDGLGKQAPRVRVSVQVTSKMVSVAVSGVLPPVELGGSLSLSSSGMPPSGPSLTIGGTPAVAMTIPLKIAVFAGDPIYLSGTIGGGLGRGGTLTGELTMEGTWKGALGIPALTLKVLRVAVGWSPPRPFPTSFRLSGTASLRIDTPTSREARVLEGGCACQSLTGREELEVVQRGAVALGVRQIDISVRMGVGGSLASNYFALFLSELTLEDLAHAVGIDVTQLPSRVRSSGISPVKKGANCRNPTPSTHPACYAYITYATERVVADGITIPRGFFMSGELNLLGWKFAVNVALSSQRIYVSAVMEPILTKLGGKTFALTKSLETTSEGPVFNLDSQEGTATLHAAMLLEVLGFEGAVDLDIGESGMNLHGEVSLFDKALTSQVDGCWDHETQNLRLSLIQEAASFTYIPLTFKELVFESCSGTTSLRALVSVFGISAVETELDFERTAKGFQIKIELRLPVMEVTIAGTFASPIWNSRLAVSPQFHFPAKVPDAVSKVVAAAKSAWNALADEVAKLKRDVCYYMKKLGLSSCNDKRDPSSLLNFARDESYPLRVTLLNIGMAVVGSRIPVIGWLFGYGASDVRRVDTRKKRGGCTVYQYQWKECIRILFWKVACSNHRGDEFILSECYERQTQHIEDLSEKTEDLEETNTQLQDEKRRFADLNLLVNGKEFTFTVESEVTKITKLTVHLTLKTLVPVIDGPDRVVVLNVVIDLSTDQRAVQSKQDALDRFVAEVGDVAVRNVGSFLVAELRTVGFPPMMDYQEEVVLTCQDSLNLTHVKPRMVVDPNCKQGGEGDHVVVEKMEVLTKAEQDKRYPDRVCGAQVLRITWVGRDHPKRCGREVRGVQYVQVLPSVPTFSSFPATKSVSSSKSLDPKGLGMPSVDNPCWADIDLSANHYVEHVGCRKYVIEREWVAEVKYHEGCTEAPLALRRNQTIRLSVGKKVSRANTNFFKTFGIHNYKKDPKC